MNPLFLGGVALAGVARIPLNIHIFIVLISSQSTEAGIHIGTIDGPYFIFRKFIIMI